MPMIMSAKAFKKKIWDVQGIRITLPEDVDRVVLKNDTLITTKVPDNWSVNQFKQYCSKMVKMYVYEEKKHAEDESGIQKDIVDGRKTRGSKRNKSRESISSDFEL